MGKQNQKQKKVNPHKIKMRVVDGKEKEKRIEEYEKKRNNEINKCDKKKREANTSIGLH